MFAPITKAFNALSTPVQTGLKVVGGFAAAAVTATASYLGLKALGFSAVIPSKIFATVSSSNFMIGGVVGGVIGAGCFALASLCFLTNVYLKNRV